MNEAIKLAIEKGGYRFDADGEIEVFPDGNVQVVNYKKASRGGYPVKCFDKEWIVLQPEFWQALSNALGWKRTYKMGVQHIVGQSWVIIPAWQYEAHQYFDLLLTAGDTEAFWKELLKQRV